MTAGEPTDVRSTAPAEPGFALTSFALWGGIVLWGVHLVASITLVNPACHNGVTWVINLLTGVTAAGAVAAIASGWLISHRYGQGDEQYHHRNRFIGGLAMIFNVASLALILLEGYPVAAINACRR